MEGGPRRANSGQGVRDPRTRAPSLRPCLTYLTLTSFPSHLPGILQGSPPHSSHQRPRQGDMCCRQSVWTMFLPGHPCAAQEAKSRFSGSKTLGSNRLQQFQQPKASPPACPSRASSCETALPSASHGPGQEGLRPQQSKEQPRSVKASLTN